MRQSHCGVPASISAQRRGGLWFAGESGPGRLLVRCTPRCQQAVPRAITAQHRRLHCTRATLLVHSAQARLRPKQSVRRSRQGRRDKSPPPSPPPGSSNAQRILPSSPPSNEPPFNLGATSALDSSGAGLSKPPIAKKANDAKAGANIQGSNLQVHRPNGRVRNPLRPALRCGVAGNGEACNGLEWRE